MLVQLNPYFYSQIAPHYIRYHTKPDEKKLNKKKEASGSFVTKTWKRRDHMELIVIKRDK